MRSHIRSWAFPLLAIFCSVFFATILAKPTYADRHQCLNFIYNYTVKTYLGPIVSEEKLHNTVLGTSTSDSICATVDDEGRIVNLYSNDEKADPLNEKSRHLYFFYPDLKDDQGWFHGNTIHLKILTGEGKLLYAENQELVEVLYETTFSVKIDQTKWEDLSKEIESYVKKNATNFSYKQDNKPIHIGGQLKWGTIVKELILDHSWIGPDPHGGPLDKKEQKHSNYEDRICRENAGSFGWILCPVITGLTSFMGGAYDSAVKPLLEIDIKIINRDSGTYKAWEVFRNFANVIFVILLLIVLFSQLTGIGIDNYGIKKILPQLIVSAVLINLSFIICQFAVDVSNIVGNGLNGLLSSIAGQISGSANVNVATGMQKATASVATLVLGGAAGTIAVFAVGWALILPVLLSILSAALAVLLMFVLLGVRQAAALLLVAISPLAFACYILPGTKKLFDKWLNMFKGVLIMYPLSGLLIGGGFLASSIISVSDSDNVFVRITGLMLMVMPYFLLPSLIKKTFSAIDSVAAAIASKGDSLRVGAVSGIRKSELYSETKNRLIAGRPDGARARFAQTGVGRFLGFHRGMSRARSRVIADTEKEAAATNLMGDGYTAGLAAVQDAAVQQRSKARTALAMREYSGEGIEQLQNRWNTAFDNNNAEELDALTNVMTQRFGPSATRTISQSLNARTGVANNVNYQNSLRTLQNTMNNNSAFASMMKEKTPDAYEMVSNAGMRYDQTAGEMVYEDMGWFVENQQTATSATDWAKTSTVTLARAAEHKLSERMLTDLLTSDDPAIRSGLQSEDNKREILEAALYNRRHNTNLPMDEALTRYRDEENARRRAERIRDARRNRRR